jgi:aryl-alcohol dehydrogenase-like predicted oxidoreductase
MLNQPISKITFGTVQLGIPYGIASKSGQPDISQSHELLNDALQHGITTLDTARQYGASEEVIGSFKETGKFTIVSKFKLSNNAIYNTQLAISEAEKSVVESCSYLKRSSLPILLFHKNPDQAIEQVAKILPDIFDYLINKSLISEGGISVFEPGELLQIQNWEKIKSIQVPMNILDSRMLRNGIMERLIENNIKVFIRSIYLQGLLLMDENNIPERLQFSKVFINKLRQIATEENLSIKELAFLFVRDCPGVTSLVIGAENREQLKENIALMNLPGISENLRNRIISEFNNVPEKLITPAFWN